MILYLDARTNIPDVYVDFIEVRLKNGEEVSLNWDESGISRSETGFDARYKGVYFGDEYANGRLADLEGLEITDIGLYFEATGSFEFAIQEMVFEDDGESLTISTPVIPPNCSGLEVLQAKPLAEQIQSASNRADFLSAGPQPMAKAAPDKDSIQITVSKDELAMLKESLDVMGDQRADREGYSSGEAYWDLKEKLEAFEEKAVLQQAPEPSR